MLCCLVLLLTKRRGDAGLLRLRACGLAGFGDLVAQLQMQLQLRLRLRLQCGAVQRSAAQETRRLGRRRVQKLS